MINSHISKFTDTISHDLTYVSTKFIESGFITQTATTCILTKLGVGDRDKASQLLDCVTTNYKTAPQKQEWVDKFVAVFSSQPAYEGLAALLTEKLTHQVEVYGGIVCVILQFELWCVVCYSHALYRSCYILLSHPVGKQSSKQSSDGTGELHT